MKVLISQIISVLVLLFFGFSVVVMVVGFYDFLTLAEDKCEMTYMFEYPQYIQVPVQDKSDKYKLYVYGEGRYAASLSARYFHGIPVLFIPGNAGCFKQVRSFASVAYRMHLDLQKVHHFNFYTIDFNEEFCGLYGGLLYEQAKFVRSAIRTIQSLYKHNTKVALIGHSMGGLVAKSVFLDPNFDYNSVDLILTLSTPHYSHPFFNDYFLYTFYRDWNSYVDKNPDIYRDKVFISVSNGVRDRMIQSYQTVIQTGREGNSQNVINVITTHIPNVQVSPDHLQSVWCRQFVKKVCLLLFDLIDRDSLQIIVDVERIRDISRSSLVEYTPTINKPGKLPDRKAELVTIDDKIYTRLESKRGWKLYSIHKAAHQTLTLAVDNPPKVPWLFSCNKQDECVDITSRVISYLDDAHLYTVKDSSDGVYYIYTNVNIAVNKKKAQAKLFVKLGSDGGTGVVDALLSEDLQVKHTLTYTIQMNTYTHHYSPYWNVYNVKVLPDKKCASATPNLKPQARMRYGTESSYGVLSDSSHHLAVKVLTSTNQQLLQPAPEVDLLLDPRCTYSVDIRLNLLETAGNFIRYYYHYLWSMILFVVLSLLADIFYDPYRPFDVKSRLVKDLVLVFGSSTLLQLILPHNLRQGFDWLKVHHMALGIMLCAAYVVVVAAGLLFFILVKILFVICKVANLLNHNAWYYSYKVQLPVVVLSYLTSSSFGILLNLILLVAFLSSRQQHGKPLLISLLLLELLGYGFALQVPALISWFKNASIGHFTLENDHISTLVLVATTPCYKLLLPLLSPTSPPQNHPHKYHVIALTSAKLLTISFIITRPYLAVFVIASLIVSLAGCSFFVMNPDKDKVS